MIRRLACGDTLHELALRMGPRGSQVSVDGAPFELELRELAPGTFQLRLGARSELFHCVRDGGAVHLSFRGATYLLSEPREGVRPAQRHARGGLEAPMPGKVIKVNVVPGQSVARGAELLVVEAMKMENALRAPRDGRVRSVAARVGDMVSPGTVLVELE